MIKRITDIRSLVVKMFSDKTHIKVVLHIFGLVVAGCTAAVDGLHRVSWSAYGATYVRH